MISPYQMMGGGDTPPDFTRTRGAGGFQKLSQRAEQTGAQISELTLRQAMLKHQKDQLTRQKSAYEQLIKKIQGSV